MSDRIRVVVLGGSGMLGSMLVDVLARVPEIDLAVSVRPHAVVRTLGRVFHLDVRSTDSELAVAVAGVRYVINAIGLIKQRMCDQDPCSIDAALSTNGVFPSRLARVCEQAGATLLQIATDCVFRGNQGAYVEDSLHDAADVYGKTKSLGETKHAAARHLRCSIVGPERDSQSLLGWFLSQPPGAVVHGFDNHRWNGVTTLMFARLCRGIVLTAPQLPLVQHVVPADVITKYELLTLFREHFGRHDLTIVPSDASERIDRSLSTNQSEVNRYLWTVAGYKSPPQIAALISELAAWKAVS